MIVLQNKPIIRRNAVTNHNLPDDLHPVLARIYASRNITQADELDNSLDQLLSPADIMGIDQAVSLLLQALTQQKRIMIVADYDADGATSCAVAVKGLRLLGFTHVSYIVPDRFHLGYGLTPEIVELVIPEKPDLIITVDNGIASVDGVVAARDHGISVLITDHHLPGPVLPDADVIINTNQAGDKFASKNLAGVGTIFYVLLALRTRLRENHWFQENEMKEPNLAELLDLVAVGTVADLVPLDHNNRIMVAQGLARINQGKCCEGIKALAAVSGHACPTLSATDLGFFLAPRLNAAGRLQNMQLGIECLITDDAANAGRIATELDELNQQRRDIQFEMQKQATLAVEALDLAPSNLPKALCLFNDSWHQGVIGLVASRLKDQLHRPIIAFAPGGNGSIKGSARSIPGLHIRDALDRVASKHPDLLSKFGGHAMAAGLTIAEDRFEAFKNAFYDEVDLLLDDEHLRQTVISDGELDETSFAMAFAELLRGSGPWGQAFPEPVFDGSFEVIGQRIVGDKHLKMQLRPLAGITEVDAIAFNFAPDGMLPDWQAIRVAYKLDINEFRGRRNLQLIINHAEALTA